MRNLEQINGTYYATVLVPKELREAIGKVRFRKSLGTGSKREAETLAAPLLAHWRALIRKARGETNAVANEAMRWRSALSQAEDSDAEDTATLALSDHLDTVEERSGYDSAKAFADIALGQATPSDHYRERWEASIAATLVPKTVDGMKKDIGKLLARFPTLEGIKKGPVRLWLDDLRQQGANDSALRRMLFACRSYWKFMVQYDAVDADSMPFGGVLPAAQKKRGRSKTDNLPYRPAEVVRLWEAAKTSTIGKGRSAKPDTQLADLILLGAFTGARIEELCALKVGKVSDDTLSIEDAKTAAGWREVPIHSRIAPLVRKLKESSKDGYLMSGLSINKHGDRSNAIGKRFGRLKTSLGFLQDSHTFHSLRSTVATQLENAGVPENVAADILGHDKPRMTYGLYSGGLDMAAMREALEKVTYPLP